MKKLISSLVAIAIILIGSFSLATPESAKPLIVLTKNNTLVLNEQVNFESTAKLIVHARELDNEFFSEYTKKPIYLFLNTPGGDIQAGLELTQVLSALNRPVHTITLFSASMGFQIVEQLKDRDIMQNGIMMSHRAAGGFEGSFGGEAPSQIDSRYRIWLQRIKEMDEQTVLRTNGKQTLASYVKAYSPEMWRTAQESVKEGYSDNIVQVRCDSSLSGVNEKQIEMLGLTIKYDTDKCPINTGILNVRMSIKTNKGMKELTKFNSEGGSYGADCLTVAAIDANKLCALDTTLNPSKIIETRSKLVDLVEFNKSRVIPIRF